MYDIQYRVHRSFRYVIGNQIIKSRVHIPAPARYRLVRFFSAGDQINGAAAAAAAAVAAVAAAVATAAAATAAAVGIGVAPHYYYYQ